MTHHTTPQTMRLPARLPHRLPDWQLRLEAFVSAHQCQPFAWGANDCATFAANCVQALTGQDPAPAGLRNHRTAKQATRTLNRHGGLVGIATAVFGQPVPVAGAQVGDVLLVRFGKRMALGICNGATVIGPGPAGTVAVGFDRAAACWRVA